jgi:hypothetical protein
MKRVTLLVGAAIIAALFILTTPGNAQVKKGEALEPTQTPWIIYIAITPTPAVLTFDIISGKSGDLEAINRHIEDELVPWMVKRQDEYLARYGHYFQGLPTHSIAPSEKPEYPDRWLDAPTDQPLSWSQVKMIPYDQMPYEMRVDVYDGPYGRGWVLYITALKLERCINNGPGGNFEYDWKPIE